jgi:hypothetical protein
VTLDQVNYLNTGLMLLAAGVALLLPFELFLFAYAILGPAHYLTQISWLHDHQYFTTGKYDFVLLVLLTLPIAARFVFGDWLPEGVNWDGIFAFVALLAAAGMVYFNRGFHKAALGAVAALCAAYICRVPDIALLFSFFVPTLIHVYVFTGAFILYGTLRNRSVSGWLSFAVFVLCGVGFFAFDIPNWGYGATCGNTATVYPRIWPEFRVGFGGGCNAFRRLRVYVSLSELVFEDQGDPLARDSPAALYRDSSLIRTVSGDLRDRLPVGYRRPVLFELDPCFSGIPPQPQDFCRNRQLPAQGMRRSFCALAGCRLYAAVLRRWPFYE